MNHENLPKAGLRQAVPFFMVENMLRSLQFYRDTLQFEVKIKWEPRGTIEWCWLQRDDAALMLQEYRGLPPAVKRGEGVSVCFICDDALVVHQHLLQLGVQTKEPFVGNGMWVVELTDPDGYCIYFESLTDIAEETTYSQWRKLQ